MKDTKCDCCMWDDIGYKHEPQCSSLKSTLTIEEKCATCGTKMNKDSTQIATDHECRPIEEISEEEKWNNVKRLSQKYLTVKDFLPIEEKCPMKGKMCQCSSDEICHHNKHVDTDISEKEEKTDISKPIENNEIAVGWEELFNELLGEELDNPARAFIFHTDTKERIKNFISQAIKSALQKQKSEIVEKIEKLRRTPENTMRESIAICVNETLDEVLSAIKEVE